MCQCRRFILEYFVILPSGPFIMTVFNFNRYGVTIQYEFEFGKEAVRSAAWLFPMQMKIVNLVMIE